MKSAYLVWMTLLFIASSASLALAHHSWPASYDLEKTIELEGELFRFVYRNPHSLVEILVTSDSGETERWDAEWGGVFELRGQGVGRSSLRPGDWLRITGYRARNPQDRRLRLNTLARESDGFSWGFRSGEAFN